MKQLFIILVAVGVGTQNLDLCPFECTCERTSVVCKGLDRFPSGLPRDMETIVFDVSDFGSDFTQNALQDFKRLKTIKFMNSKFDVLHSCAISDLTNVSKLEFSKVEIGEIVTNGFSHLSNIKEISIVNSTIRKLHSYAFNDIKFVDNFTISDVKILQLDNFAFNNFTSFRFIQLRRLKTLATAQQPFLNFASIDHFELKGCSFSSSMCGMTEILNNDTVKKIKFQQNMLQCYCNTTWIFDVHRNPKDFEANGNTCLWSGENVDITSIDKSQFCKVDEIPTCGDGSRRSKVRTCQMFTMDEPIMPGETVQYPVTDSSKNMAVSIYNQKTLLVLTLIISSLLFVSC